MAMAMNRIEGIANFDRWLTAYRPEELWMNGDGQLISCGVQLEQIHQNNQLRIAERPPKKSWLVASS